MLKLVIPLLCLTISVNALAAPQHKVESITEKAAIEQVEADLDAMQSTLTAQGSMGGGMHQGPSGNTKKNNSVDQNPAGSMPADSMGMGMGMRPGRMGSMMGNAKMPEGPDANPAAAATAGNGHVLHLGERDFYLDMQSTLVLTDAQVRSLTAHRAQWLSELAAHQATIEAAEAQLWQLTQSVTPDPDRLAAAVREVEQLRSAQRLAFITSVSDAARTLTPAQITVARSLPFDSTQ